MLVLSRAHSPERPSQDSNPLPTDCETRALANAPPGTLYRGCYIVSRTTVAILNYFHLDLDVSCWI